MDTTEAAAIHARRMDRMYRLQRHFYDATRKYYLLGRDRTIRQMGVKPGASVLELGCGTGRNLKLIAETFPDVTVCGLDISREMLSSARQTLSKANIEATLVAADATSFTPADFGRSGFDHILLSYSLSMIPNWQDTVANAVATLSPGGVLHIVDFGQQENLPRWFSHLLFAWLKAFEVTPRQELRETVERIARASNSNWQFTTLFAGYAWQAKVTKA